MTTPFRPLSEDLKPQPMRACRSTASEVVITMSPPPRNTCSSCQHYREGGLCCRFPPVICHPAPQGLDDIHRGTPAFVFPEVKPDDSCGEYQWVGHNMGPQIERRG